MKAASASKAAALHRYSFSYGPSPIHSVTVRAATEAKARVKACLVMDARYLKAGKEAPVAWTLRLIIFDGAVTSRTQAA